MHAIVSKGPRWHVCVGAEALRIRAADWIARAASDAIRARDAFHIVLAGGQTPSGVYTRLRPLETDWSAWNVYFGDERCVAADGTDSNSRMAFDALFRHVPVRLERVHVIRAELGPAAGAAEYGERLAGAPTFDLVLLGLGADGHTASLFDGREWGVDSDAPDVLPVFDAPRPPAQRISLSVQRLSRSRAVLFLVAGPEKRDAIERWRRGQRLPAAAIWPITGVDVLVEKICLED